eukprot:15241837-Ditylum_brightwellii.AAC.1
MQKRYDKTSIMVNNKCHEVFFGEDINYQLQNMCSQGGTNNDSLAFRKDPIAESLFAVRLFECIIVGNCKSTSPCALACATTAAVMKDEFHPGRSS